MGSFTMTETRRRLRHLAAQARQVARQPSNVKVEVGGRRIPVHTDTQPAQADCYPEGDDLVAYMTMGEAARDPEFQRHGAVAHIYLSTTGPWGELQAICVGWLGTPDHEPALIDADGKPVTR